MSTATEVKFETDTNKQKRHWLFTWNNYPQNAEELLKKLKYKYIVGGYEIAPTTGTPHIQGYVEFGCGKRLGTMVKAVPGIHWMVANGSAKQNIEYCRKLNEPKPNEKWFQDGTVSEQGKRGDLDEIKTQIDAGASMLTIAEDNFTPFIRYHRGFEKYKYMRDQQNASNQLREVDVQYHWGVTGSGKTYNAFKENPGCFVVSEGVTGFWWTGYTGQDVVIMDEFRGNVPACQLLRILDIYPVQLSVHGGSMWCSTTKFIITSNLDFDDLYPNVDERTKAALARRIKSRKFYGTAYSDKEEKKCDATEVTGVIVAPVDNDEALPAAVPPTAVGAPDGAFSW